MNSVVKPGSEKKRKPPICFLCGHLLKPSETGMCCSAFPNGVPAAIRENQADHRKPFEGDNGIRYNPVGNENLSPQEAAAYAIKLFGELSM